MTIATESDKIIRSLYQITHDYQKGFDIQIIQLLMLGLERFNLDIGILSKIEGDKYTVLHSVSPENIGISSGDQFNYHSTYCHITCGSFGPVFVEHIGIHRQYSKHPAYKALGLESYIGIPIFVEDEVYGTLNFSSAVPYPRKFQEIDIDALKLMATWVEVEIIRRNQEEKLRELNNKLEYQALYDELTSMANRRCMFKTIHTAIERMKDCEGKGSLAVIDIDHFKLVNDQYGHLEGDAVLKKTAQILHANLSDADFIARYGGEEFVVWLPDRSDKERQTVIAELHSSVNSIVLDKVPLTVSIGVCEFNFEQHIETESNISTLEQIIAVADEALYSAKNSGRNKIITRLFSQKVLSE
ncbi:diguanylate cyclase [Vibrio ostreicida]|uniref:diguanylate cyclase n=1 Tax=Vibrio ostreicida TaxID=526588 RepID=A0ABT8BSM8_9VIBR|nr:diguanylate cyclase [Vibrio ostreicida]MDN3610151.1 diguanylate cyclase [Vibrio ostreicida]NPD07826.1 sensor domain-containing diguanylate cyclase [Vibrio ostreicida]